MQNYIEMLAAKMIVSAQVPVPKKIEMNNGNTHEFLYF
jgi:hypothetical protein